MNNEKIRAELIKALANTTQFKCAVESGVSIPTIQTFIAGKKVSQTTLEKFNKWIESNKGR